MKPIPMQPGQKAVMIEMTDDRRARFSAIATDCVNRIVNDTETPIEAFMVLHFIKLALEQLSGLTFDRGIVINHDDVEQNPQT